MRELSLVPRVDDLARRGLRAGIHPHVERRIGRVRESAFDLVDLHGRDPDVEQNCVCADAVRGQLAEHEGEVTAQETDVGARLSP